MRGKGTDSERGLCRRFHERSEEGRAVQKRIENQEGTQKNEPKKGRERDVIWKPQAGKGT